MVSRYLSQPIRLVGGLATVALTADADRHLRDKILAVLFTSPGERINRPDFGVGLRRSLFEGIDDLMTAALRFRIVQGLRRDIGPEIVVEDVRVVPDPDAGEITIYIDYQRAGDGAAQGLEVRL
jgi:uncharacterized protein